jgi:hypothetical protein
MLTTFPQTETITWFFLGTPFGPKGMTSILTTATGKQLSIPRVQNKE